MPLSDNPYKYAWNAVDKKSKLMSRTLENAPSSISFVHASCVKEIESGFESRMTRRHLLQSSNPLLGLAPVVILGSASLSFLHVRLEMDNLLPMYEKAIPSIVPHGQLQWKPRSCYTYLEVLCSSPEGNCRYSGFTL